MQDSVFRGKPEPALEGRRWSSCGLQGVNVLVEEEDPRQRKGRAKV